MTEAEFNYRFPQPTEREQIEVDILSYDLTYNMRMLYQKLGAYKTREIIKEEIKLIEGSTFDGSL